MNAKSDRQSRTPRRLRALVLAAVAVLMLAASWRGVFDTNENPRGWDTTQITAFILAEVNLSVTRWQLGDTLSICTRGSSQCILVAYANPMSQFAWAKARNVDSREKPIDATLWERFINWLWGQSSTVITELAMVGFLWDTGIVPIGVVTVGPLVPSGQGGVSLSCSACHNGDFGRARQVDGPVFAGLVVPQPMTRELAQVVDLHLNSVDWPLIASISDFVTFGLAAEVKHP